MNRKSDFSSAGIKATTNRLLVMEVLTEHPQLSARDIWRNLLGKKENIGFATVYRILSLLCDAGLVRKIPAEGGALFENVQEDDFPQIVCSRCGKVEEVKDPSFLKTNADVMKGRGLSANDPLLMYADCKRKECDDGKA